MLSYTWVVDLKKLQALAVGLGFQRRGVGVEEVPQREGMKHVKRNKILYSTTLK